MSAQEATGAFATATENLVSSPSPVMLDIIDTINFLKLPINCVLDGQQDNMQEGFAQSDVRDPDFRSVTNLEGSGRFQLSESASSFTTKTGHRGYD